LGIGIETKVVATAAADPSRDLRRGIDLMSDETAALSITLLKAVLLQ
jgi:hypothetical protein